MINKKLEMAFFLFVFLLSIPIVISQGAPPAASWWGTAEIDGNTSTSGAVVEAFINSVSVANTTVGAYTSSYYLLDVPCTNGSSVVIKIYGVAVNQTGQVCSQGTSTQLNLWMNKTANGIACTYSGGCNSGYCVDGYCCDSACNGADQDCNVTGHEGTCTSTAAVTTTTPSGGGGGGGGGGAVTTTTTTTPVTTIPGVTTTTSPKVTTKPKPVTTIPPSVTTKPKRVSLGIELSTMQILGIIVGVVVILALVIFLFVRFQSVKMAT